MVAAGMGLAFNRVFNRTYALKAPREEKILFLPITLVFIDRRGRIQRIIWKRPIVKFPGIKWSQAMIRTGGSPCGLPPRRSKFETFFLPKKDIDGRGDNSLEFGPRRLIIGGESPSPKIL